MIIKLNYISMQNGTMFYLLDLIDHLWMMGLNLRGTFLNQPNLIQGQMIACCTNTLGEPAPTLDNPYPW